MNSWLEDAKVILIMMTVLFGSAEISRRVVDGYYATSISRPLPLIGYFFASLVMITIFFWFFVKREESFVDSKRKFREIIEERESLRESFWVFLQPFLDMEWPKKVMSPLSWFLIYSKLFFVVGSEFWYVVEIETVLVQTLGRVFYLVAIYALLVRHFEELPSLPSG